MSEEAELIERFIRSIEEFRQKHCNPNEPSGWLPREEFFRKYNQANEGCGELRLLLLRSVGPPQTDELLHRLATHFRELEGLTEHLLECSGRPYLESGGERRAEDAAARAAWLRELDALFHGPVVPAFYDDLRQAAIGEAQGGDKPAEAMSDEAKALALLVEHPDWSPADVAKAVGCSRQNLYKMKKYQTARKAMKAAAKAIPRGVVTVRNTHGNKNRDLDAIDE